MTRAHRIRIATTFAVLLASRDLAGQTSSGRPQLPAPTGPLAVARIDFQWTDPTRRDSDESSNRELLVHVAYPTRSPGTSRVPYIQDFDAVRKTLSSSELTGLFRPAPYSWLETNGLPETHMTEGAPIAPGEKYPILIFSHGLGNAHFLYTAEIEDLVSHGYVVVAIDHAPDAAFVWLANRRFIPYAADAWSREMRKPGGYVAYAKKRIEQVWAPDIRFVIDQLIRYNDMPSLAAPFGGHLDVNRIGAFGHSMGGLAAVRACQLEPRIRACMNQDADVAGSPFIDPLPQLLQPLLFVTAATANVFKESFVRPPDAALAEMKTSRAQYDADVKRVQRNQDVAMASVSGGSYRVLIDIPGFIHRSFSDLTLLAAENDLTVRADALRDFRISQKYTLAFFDKFLKGRKDTQLDRLPTFDPGVQVDRFGTR